MAHDLHNALTEAGVIRYGIIDAAPVDEAEMARYEAWLAAGHNGAMTYLANHHHVRRDPRRLIETADGARSMIVCALPYAHPWEGNIDGLDIAMYARGEDYHDVARRRLQPVADLIGGTTRICVDSAPLRERYWAVRAGIGFVGRNGTLIIPGTGSYIFIATILTDKYLTPTMPADHSRAAAHCADCGACLRACPGGALHGDGSMDARRCLSYLTIEYRGDFSPEMTPMGRTLYGCDICQRVCPHNAAPPMGLPEFLPRPICATLTRSDIAQMTPAAFKAAFAGSPIVRTRLTGLQRNAGAINDK